MIWDLIEESQFDKHFSHPQLTITRLLLDQNIITQLKNQNPKLLTYLNDHKEEFITELIEYTIIMPELSDGSDRCFKLPYISSQLLAIDSELIYVEFFKEGVPEEENKFWKRLLCFLDSSAAQNEILMGYFEKVINNLYNGNKAKTARIISIQLQKFQKLLINGSIGDILKKCIILFTTPQGQVLTERQKILSKVIEHFSLTSNQQEREICSDILIDVVNKFQAFSSGENLLSQLLTNENLNKIYKVVHSIAINTFLVNLLKKSQQKIVNQKDQAVKILSIPQSHLSKISNHIELQVEQLQKLLSTQQYIMNQNKALVRKSNKKIYSILSLISLAIQEGQFNFISCLFVNNLWKLLILYPYNNILHVSILKIFTNITKLSKKQLIDIFLKQFKAYILELQKHNFQMFRPFLYSIWKETVNLDIPKGFQQIDQKYARFIEQKLEPLTKYEINKKKVLASTQIQNKLIVDEQDKQNSQNLSNSDVQEYLPPTDPFQQEVVINNEKPVQMVKTSIQFDFFSKWEDQKPIEENKSVKQDLFDDFTNFF